MAEAMKSTQAIPQQSQVQEQQLSQAQRKEMLTKIGGSDRILSGIYSSLEPNTSVSIDKYGNAKVTCPPLENLVGEEIHRELAGKSVDAVKSRDNFLVAGKSEGKVKHEYLLRASQETVNVLSGVDDESLSAVHDIAAKPAVVSPQALKVTKEGEVAIVNLSSDELQARGQETAYLSSY